MNGDFTRSTFDPRKHYSGVRMQQGRVQLDADWNEQVDIESYRDATTTGDVVGASGVPVLPDGTSSGFRVHLSGTDASVAFTDMVIRPGRIYVDGLLCENEADVPYLDQPDLAGSEPADGLNIVYLHVWQRHITTLDDPSIREVALGGPDTATRTRTVWQVRMLPVTPSQGVTPVCTTDFPEWRTLTAASSGRLRAQTKVEEGDGDGGPCVIPPNAGYRGLENQLYRVEIHRVSDGEITYKWSRDNGAFTYAVEQFSASSATAAQIVLKNLGKDQNSSLAVNSWIEIQSRTGDLERSAGVLARITEIDTVDRRITVVSTIADRPLTDFNDVAAEELSTRRWDFTGMELPTTSVPSSGPLPWIDLEQGVQVQFVQAAGDTAYGDAAYHVGDYWTIPARVATQDIEWPRESDDPVAAAPAGIAHHYSRLALVTVEEGAFDRSSLKDCRSTFLPLTEIPKLAFHFVGGDGQDAAPGATLPRPLEVAVTERGRKAFGKRVRFTVTGGYGRVGLVDGDPADADVEVIVETDINGIAACTFTLDALNASQQVTAVLLGEEDIPMLLNVVHFDASISSSGVVFSYVGGDGQQGHAGEWLPQSLAVGVNENGGVVVGARVRFTIVEGDGLLRILHPTGSLVEMETGQTLIAETRADGVALCDWQLDTISENQRVEARLLDANDEPRNVTPITFSASIASNTEFLYVSGDGQEARPGAAVPMPLEVGVMDGESVVQGAYVRFVVRRGVGTLTAGTVTGVSDVVVRTGLDGVASVRWTLDAIDSSQQVEARLVQENGDPLDFTPIRFNANLSRAADVAYNPPSDCTRAAGATTVQEALDELCASACDCGSDCPPVIRIVGVHLGTSTSALGAPVNPYSVLTMGTLSHGLRIVADTEIDAASVKPCSVFADAQFPYPLESNDRVSWGLPTTINAEDPLSEQIVGTRPIGMVANVDVDPFDNHVIRWTPSANMLDLFDAMITANIPHDNVTVPVKLAIKGSSIWAETNVRQLLAGSTGFGGNVVMPPGSRDCDEPSDFVFCFLITPNPAEPCERIAAITFDQPIIGGDTAHGHIYFERPVSTNVIPQLKITSNATTVIPDTGLELVPHPAPGATTATEFTFDMPTDAVASTKSVTLTVSPANDNDPCKRTTTTVVTVTAEPCNGIASVSLPTSVVIGHPIVGTITMSDTNRVNRTLTIATNNTALVPNPSAIVVHPTDDLVVPISIATTTTGSVITGVMNTTPVTVTVTDPCGGERTVVVNVEPEPCDEVASIVYAPIVGGNPLTLDVTFKAPLKRQRVIHFLSSDTALIADRTATFDPVPGQVLYHVAYSTTGSVARDTTVTLTADPCGETRYIPIELKKRPCETLDWSIDTNVIGGGLLHGVINLSAEASREYAVTFSVLNDPLVSIPNSQVVTIPIHHAAGSVPFTLTTAQVDRATTVTVQAILCGEVISRTVTVLPVPCEDILDILNLPNPLVANSTYNPQVLLSGASYTANHPITVTCSSPAMFETFQVAVAKDQSVISFPLTLNDVQTKFIDITFTRCGEIMRTIRREVAHPQPDVPVIVSGVMYNPSHPDYKVRFHNPTDVPAVDIRELGFSPNEFGLRLEFGFLDVLPDPSSVTTATVLIHDMGDTSSGGAVAGAAAATVPVPVTGLDVHFESGKVVCVIPIGKLSVFRRYRVTLRGAGSGPVITSPAILGGMRLNGAFVLPFNISGSGPMVPTGTTAGATSGSDFVASFTLMYS